MKILYTISTIHGLGADRWIYEGYKNAFESRGYKFFVVTENNSLINSVQTIRPDILMLNFALLNKYTNQDRCSSLKLLRIIKKYKIKIFCVMGAEPNASDKDIEYAKKCTPYLDYIYSYYVSEITHQFEKKIGKTVHFLPLAANSEIYFPDKPNEKFICDIAFVGSKYTAKKDAYKKLLYPLFKKYKVRIYGPGWKKSDKFLRILSGIFRKLKVEPLIKFVNQKRVLLSSDEERQLYASAKICINIHEYYPNGKIRGFSNEREFKIPASGGFQLSDYIPGMERYFDLDKEIITVKNRKDWFEKIDYYLTHDKERIKIQKAGTKRALRDHTYHNRIKQIIKIYKNLEGHEK